MTRAELNRLLNRGYVADVHVEEHTEPQGFVKKVQIYPKAIRQDDYCAAGRRPREC